MVAQLPVSLAGFLNDPFFTLVNARKVRREQTNRKKTLPKAPQSFSRNMGPLF